MIGNILDILKDIILNLVSSHCEKCVWTRDFLMTGWVAAPEKGEFGVASYSMDFFFHHFIIMHDVRIIILTAN